MRVEHRRSVGTHVREEHTCHGGKVANFSDQRLGSRRKKDDCEQQELMRWDGHANMPCSERVVALPHRNCTRFVSSLTTHSLTHSHEYGLHTRQTYIVIQRKRERVRETNVMMGQREHYQAWKDSEQLQWVVGWVARHTMHTCVNLLNDGLEETHQPRGKTILQLHRLLFTLRVGVVRTRTKALHLGVGHRPHTQHCCERVASELSR